MPPTPSRAAPRPPQRVPQRDAALIEEEEDSGGPFQVDAAAIPDGMSYEWRRVTYAGKEDVRHQARAHRRHWTPVPKKRHPEIVGREAATKDPEGAIIVDGLMLMERAATLTRDAAGLRDARAKERVQNQVKSLKLTPEGQLPRVRVEAKKKYNIQVAEPDDRPQAAAAEEE
jgi:hypothetical protein